MSMTSGPTVPLEIGKSKVLLPTVSVAVLPWDVAIVKSPMRSLRKPALCTSCETAVRSAGRQNEVMKWVAYCRVRCKVAGKRFSLDPDRQAGPDFPGARGRPARRIYQERSCAP